MEEVMMYWLNVRDTFINNLLVGEGGMIVNPNHLDWVIMNSNLDIFSSLL